MYYPGACAAPSVVAGREAALSNSYFGSGFLPVATSGGDADGEDFRKRVPVGQRSPVSEASYAAVRNVAVLMAGGATDRASLGKKLAATKDQPGVLAHSYTCDGKQLPLLTSVCNSNVRLLQYRDKAFTDVTGEWINGGELAGLASPTS
jgi:branched-chain amino acid transport system substrate-binding protein